MRTTGSATGAGPAGQAGHAGQAGQAGHPGQGASAPTMRAVVQDAYGQAADVLRVEQVPRPTPGAGEVLLRVGAAGVDRGVWHLMTGLPYPVRLAGYGVRAPKQRVPGMDVAGRVEAVGKGVARLRVGDDVYGVAAGSFAEYARADQDRLSPAPTGLSAEQAAALPVSGLTALHGLRDQGDVQPGQRVLVIGASGGVGSYAVQIAKALGAHVTGVSRAGKIDLVRSLGADEVLTYGTGDHTSGDLTGTGPYDVVLDTGGQRPLRVLRRLLTPRGRLVIVGSETGGRWLGGTDRQLRAMAWSPFVGQRLGTFVSTERAKDLEVLADLVESGAVRPAIDRTFPLEQAADAIGHLLSGAVRGKVVLAVRGDDPA